MSQIGSLIYGITRIWMILSHFPVSLADMATSSEEVLLVVNQVRSRKSNGTLYLMGKRLAWQEDNKDVFTISHYYADVRREFILYFKSYRWGHIKGKFHPKTNANYPKTVHIELSNDTSFISIGWSTAKLWPEVTFACLECRLANRSVFNGTVPFLKFL